VKVLTRKGWVGSEVCIALVRICDEISVESSWEGEAPAEQLGGKLLIQNGSAGASPSRIWPRPWRETISVRNYKK
jgi:hypothetical protein